MLDTWQDGETRAIDVDMMKLTLSILTKSLFDVDSSQEAEDIGEALDILQRIVAQAPVLKCKRGDAIEVAGAILAAADDYSSASVNPTQHGANR